MTKTVFLFHLDSSIFRSTDLIYPVFRMCDLLHVHTFYYDWSKRRCRIYFLRFFFFRTKSNFKGITLNKNSMQKLIYTNQYYYGVLRNYRFIVLREHGCNFK